MKNYLTKLRAIGLAACLFAVAGAAFADVKAYLDWSAFTQAAGNLGTDPLIGMVPGEAASTHVDRRTFIGSEYDYKASAQTGVLMGAGTDAEPWISTDRSTDSITFSHFSGNVTAFGGSFVGSDFTGAWAAATLRVTVTDASGLSFSQTLQAPTANSFIGFVSTGAPIVSVTLSAFSPDGGDTVWASARQIVLGQALISAVPEPSSAALLLLGVLALGRQSRARATKLRSA